MKPSESHDDALARQIALESHSRTAGLDRLRLSIARLDALGRRAEAADARTLLTAGIGPVSAYLDVLKADGRSARHVSWSWLGHLTSDEVAYLAVHTMLSLAPDMPMPQTSVARALWNALVDELRGRELARLAEEARPDDPVARNLVIGTKRLASAAKNGAAPKALRKDLRAWLASGQAHKASPLLQAIETVEERGETPIQVGFRMVQAVLESTRYFTIETDTTDAEWSRRGATVETTIRPTDETLAWLTERGHRLGLMRPVFGPLVVPPRPWRRDGGAASGGYYGPLAFRASFIRRLSRPQVEAVMHACEDVVFDAINAVQRVGWRINPQVLGVFDALVRTGTERIVPMAPTEKPVAPPGVVRPAKGEPPTEEWKRHRTKVRLWKQAERERRQKAFCIARTRVAARTLAAEDAFWFAWTCDWRGRIYPVTSGGLSPQGSDLDRGLLMFAEAKPLGDTGLAALVLHAANCLGKLPDGRKVSRLTLAERHEAMMQLVPRYASVAADPIGNRLWLDAEEPWQFLAAILDIHAALAHPGGPATYRSRLCVAVDGTCNGLQHWSALMRDRAVAERVNVAPLPRPSDVYTDVTEAVTAALEERARCGEPIATGWLKTGLVNRSLCKRPVMTSVYGSGLYGFAEQTRKAVLAAHQEARDGLAPDASGPLDVFREAADKGIKLAEPCAMLARCMADALASRLGAAVTGMAWVQEYARLAGRNGVPLTWRVPVTGWLVAQPYRAMQKKRIKSLLKHGSGLVQIRIPDPSGKADGRKQVTASAPNLIHSLDAACLHLVAAECGKPDLNVALAPVHDSFGTHAGTLGTLRAVTRQAFVRLHTLVSIDALAADFRACVAAKDEADIPPTPALGDLDITEALDSVYLFS